MNPVPRGLNSNSANLKQIICMPGVRALLHLLAVEEKITHGESECGYELNSSADSQECYIDCRKFAHLYVCAVESKASVKHHIIAFVDMKAIGEMESLANMLYETARKLGIADKRPHFYIYYYGHRPPVSLSNDGICNEIARKLRGILKNYAKMEDFCHMATAESGLASFTIFPNGQPHKPYNFNYA